MKVLLINDSTSNPNWGDRAAAISLKKMITEMGGNITEIISELELSSSSFFNKKNFQESKKCKHSAKKIIKLSIPPILFLIKEKFTKYIDCNHTYSVIPERWEDFEQLADVVFNDKGMYPNLWRAIDNSDITVIHGDGCIVGNGIIPRTELFLSYLIKKYFCKPVIIVNHTADFEHPNLYKIAQHVYPLFDDVVFRDSISLEKCKNLCAGRYAADSAFLFKPIMLKSWIPVAQRLTYFDVWPDIAQFDPAKPYLCIGGSSIYPYIKEKIDPVEGFTHLINYIISIYSNQVVLTVSDGQDQKMFRTLAEKFKLPLIGLSTPIQQIVDILGNAEAYIGGRWHPSIFALRGGTPIIPISSSTFKMKALAEMSGLSAKIFDALDLEREKKEIGQQLLNYLEQGNTLRNKISIWAEEQSITSWDNVTFLKTKI